MLPIFKRLYNWQSPIYICRYAMLINEKLARIWRKLDATDDATFTKDKRESENLPTLLTFWWWRSHIDQIIKKTYNLGSRGKNNTNKNICHSTKSDFLILEPINFSSWPLMSNFSLSSKGPFFSLIIPQRTQDDLLHLLQACFGILSNVWVRFLQDLHSKNLFLVFTTLTKWFELLHKSDCL